MTHHDDAIEAKDAEIARLTAENEALRAAGESREDMLAEMRMRGFKDGDWRDWLDNLGGPQAGVSEREHLRRLLLDLVPLENPTDDVFFRYPEADDQIDRILAAGWRPQAGVTEASRCERLEGLLRRSLAYLEGEDPMHTSNGLRNATLRAALTAALSARQEGEG